MYKEIAALILAGQYDEVVKNLTIQMKSQLPPHQRNKMATSLEQLGKQLIQAGHTSYAKHANHNEQIKKSKTVIDGWRVQCFNSIRLIRHGKEIQNIRWKRKKAEELFVFLLLQPNYRVSKEVAIEKLFYANDAERTPSQLHVVIHHIKQILREYLCIDKSITIKNGIIQLYEEMIDHVDTEKYSTLVRVGNQLWATHPDLSVELFDEAQQLYGELAPNLQYLDWLDEYRKDLQMKQTAILKRLASYYTAQQHFERAEYYGMEWINLAPYEEEAYQELIKLYIRMNKTEAAKLLYRAMEQLFRNELDIAPAHETMRMISE